MIPGHPGHLPRDTGTERADRRNVNLGPPADRPDRDAARIIAFHPEQGWSLLCNGVILFDDTGELLPDGRAVPPHRLIHIRRPVAA